MRPLATIADRPEIIAHLERQFGADNYQNEGDVIAPPIGAVIKVEEPLKTCQQGTEGKHLCNGCIPEGIYTVPALDDTGGGRWLELMPVNDPAKPVEARVGWATGVAVDWRGVKKYEFNVDIPQADSA